MKFGIALKNLMIEQGITQNELAQKIHYTQRAISKWVNLQSEPTETAIIEVARYFNVSVDYLLGRTDELGGIVPEKNSAGRTISSEEQKLLDNFRKMNHTQKIRLDAYMEGLLGTEPISKKNA